jgi:hypothetical protein
VSRTWCDPSAFTSQISLVNVRGPVPTFDSYASRRPSGDQEGAQSTPPPFGPCVSGRFAPPLAFMTQIRQFAAAKAIRRPSGDHAGVPRIVPTASRVFRLPSECIFQTDERPALSDL